MRALASPPLMGRDNPNQKGTANDIHTHIHDRWWVKASPSPVLAKTYIHIQGTANQHP